MDDVSEAQDYTMPPARLAGTSKCSTAWRMCAVLLTRVHAALWGVFTCLLGLLRAMRLRVPQPRGPAK